MSSFAPRKNALSRSERRQSECHWQSAPGLLRAELKSPGADAARLTKRCFQNSSRPDEHERCRRAPNQNFLYGVQTLQRVNLTGTHCTATGIAALKAALPKCKVIGP